MGYQCKRGFVNWDTFLRETVRFLQAAQQSAKSFLAHNSPHVMEIPDGFNSSQFDTIMSSLSRISARSNSLSNISEPSLEHLIDLAMSSQRTLSKSISDLEAEVNCLERAVSIRRKELHDVHSRLLQLQARDEPVSKTTPLSEDDQKKLNNLFCEYSKVWRNVCFVEHHLHEHKHASNLSRD